MRANHRGRQAPGVSSPDTKLGQYESLSPKMKRGTEKILRSDLLSTLNNKLVDKKRDGTMTTGQVIKKVNCSNNYWEAQKLNSMPRKNVGGGEGKSTNPDCNETHSSMYANGALNSHIADTTYMRCRRVGT